jgi:hypothetical protein
VSPSDDRHLERALDEPRERVSPTRRREARDRAVGHVANARAELPFADSAVRYFASMATCPGSLIVHADGTVAGCTEDEKPGTDPFA